MASLLCFHLENASVASNWRKVYELTLGLPSVFKPSLDRATRTSSKYLWRPELSKGLKTACAFPVNDSVPVVDGSVDIGKREGSRQKASDLKMTRDTLIKEGLKQPGTIVGLIYECDSHAVCDLSLLRGWIKDLEGFLALSLLDDESDRFEVRAR
ncbi:hypothetical protein Tco_1326635 [Tanacetum coccineum]